MAPKLALQRAVEPVRAPRRRVAIAGASGFVGRAVSRVLSERFDVVGIARTAPRDAAGVEFRPADLFNLREGEQALEGADVALYLVHSMLPSARLTQGDFADFDMLCADDFARAAARAGVRQIACLELRQVLDGRTLFTGIFDFAPSLPWWLYRATQARFHAWVMASFARHLARAR